MSYSTHKADLNNRLIPPKQGGASLVVPERFSNRILLHIIKNLWFPSLRPALLLGVQGTKGDGKSTMAREVCSIWGTHVLPLSGASLAGGLEGAPVEILANSYLEASKSLDIGASQRVVIIIDDFDLSVASSFEDRRMTVNTQLLNGFLMNLADDPLRCKGTPTKCVPIILTGNNFTCVHSPLTRHGRMELFDWVPTIQEKALILKNLFDGQIAIERQERLETFVEKYHDQPIAFFAQLFGDYADQLILQAFQERGNSSAEACQTKVLNSLKLVKLDQLVCFAEERILQSTRNFLSTPVEPSSEPKKKGFWG